MNAHGQSRARLAMGIHKKATPEGRGGRGPLSFERDTTKPHHKQN
jgi:hypothetical protein